MISGILPIDKAAGWTSHDVVARVRRLAGQKQVGHTGTLDPLATGVLLVVLGDATRLSNYLMDSEKEYLAEVVLGATTVTDDAEAPLLQQAECTHLDEEHVVSCLTSFTGTLRQIPPAYAAVRHSGEKLYALARRGIEVVPEPRTVEVHSIELLRWHTPRLTLRIRCGSGTYIRSLARDIGATLGVGGYLHALRRTASGSFGHDECLPISALELPGTLEAACVPSDRAVIHLPAVVLDASGVQDARTGRPLRLGVRAVGSVRLYDPTGTFIGLGAATDNLVRPIKIFAGAA